MTLTMIRKVFLLGSAFLLLAKVNGYAAWLKCYVDLDETEVVMNYPMLLPEKAPHSVQVEVKFAQDKEWSTSLLYPANEKSTIHARLKIPDSLSRGVQYVIEATYGGNFVNPTVMCNGRRSHGRGWDDEAILEVNGDQDKVEVWAGWATGHEPVSLTPITVLRKRGAGVEEL
jgi:hypothetical protein